MRKRPADNQVCRKTTTHRSGLAEVKYFGPQSSGKCMSKRELIEQITSLNRSARAEFLARFSEEELRDYLRQLRELSIEHRTEDLLAMQAAV